MDDWLATGISYAILLLIAESDTAGEFGVALAWGLAAVVFVRSLPAIGQQFPGLLGGSSAPASRDLSPVQPGAPQNV